MTTPKIPETKRFHTRRPFLRTFIFTACLLVLLSSAGFCEENINFTIGYEHYYQKGSYPSAIKYLKKAIEEDPESELAHLYLALSYEREKSFTEALSIWEKCLSFSPPHEDKIKAHIKNIKKLKEIFDSTEPSSIYLLQEIARDNYSGSPISFYALTAITHHHFTRKDYPAVITSYQEIRKSHPKEEMETETLCEYSYSLINAKEFATAGKILKNLLKRSDIDYDRAKIELLMATCYLAEATEYCSQNKKSSALKMYQRIMDQCSLPDQINFAKQQRDILLKERDNFLRRADRLIYLSREDTKEAGKLYSKLLKEYPEHPKRDHILFHRIETILAEEQYQKARKLYLKLASRYRNSSYAPEALFRAAQCYLKLNKRKEAMRLFQRIITSYPRSSSTCDALFSLASQYSIHLKDNKKALKYYTKLIRGFPDSQQAKDAREIIRTINQYEEAKKKR